MLSINKIVMYTGWNGFIILFVCTSFFLKNKPILLLYYTMGIIINYFLNYILKGIIKQPRPSGDVELINIATHNGKRFGNEIYGMPSGHSQLAFYSVVFIHMSLKNIKITSLYLLFAVATMYQRVAYRNHTVLQVVIGSLVGSIVGYVCFVLAQKNVVGRLLKKKDDNNLLN
jgi:membrane-associated phospholipid phosphatase